VAPVIEHLSSKLEDLSSTLVLPRKESLDGWNSKGRVLMRNVWSREGAAAQGASEACKHPPASLAECCVEASRDQERAEGKGQTRQSLHSHRARSDYVFTSQRGKASAFRSIRYNADAHCCSVWTNQP
jgi:hypothetical protein